MSYTTAAKHARASDRYLLIRVTGARYIDSALTSSGGINYTMTWAHPISRVTVAGVAMTKVTAGGAVLNAQYSYDESTGLLTLGLSGGASSTVIMEYYLFFATGKKREAYETPTDNTTTVRVWEPSVVDSPSLNQSVKNILSGVFSIESGSLTVSDDYKRIRLRSLLSRKDSFNQREIKAWLCIDGLTDINPVYTGRVNAVSSTRDTVRFEYYDEFTKLNSPCTMGDSRDYSYWNLNTWSGLDPSKAGQPIPYIIGPNSRVLWTKGFPGSMTAYFADRNHMYAATNLNSQYASTSNNRSWGLARSKSGVASHDFGTVVRCTDFGGGFAYGLFCTGHSNINVGDTVRAVRAGTTYYYQVYNTDTFTNGGNTYNIMLWQVSTAIVGMTSAELITTPSMQVYAGSRTIFYGLHYTRTEVTTDGGNKLTTIQFVNNFEATTGTTTALDPSSEAVVYRISPTGSHNHATVLKEICDKAGMTTNAASFTAAAGAFAYNAQFSIPYFDEGDFATYRDYAEAICTSTAGYLSLNSSMEAQYQLLAAPAAGTTIDDNLELSALSVQLNYADICTQLIAYNPHNQVDTAVASATGPSLTKTSAVTQYLHGVLNVNRFRHVLENLGTRLDTIFALRSSRQAVYHYKVATEQLDAVLGDNATLTSATGLLGAETSTNVRVFSIKKDIDNVEIEATDLEGL